MLPNRTSSDEENVLPLRWGEAVGHLWLLSIWNETNEAEIETLFNSLKFEEPHMAALLDSAVQK